MTRQLQEHRVSDRRHVYEHLATILRRLSPLHESMRLQPIEQLDGRVVMKLKALRQLANARLDVERQTLQGEEQLMLAWLEAGVACRLRAESQEPSDLITKLGQSSVVFISYGRAFSLHGLNLS